MKCLNQLVQLGEGEGEDKPLVFKGLALGLAKKKTHKKGRESFSQPSASQHEWLPAVGPRPSLLDQPHHSNAGLDHRDGKLFAVLLALVGIIGGDTIVRPVPAWRRSFSEQIP